MLDIEKIQWLLNEQKLDGWLIYNFKGMNDIADRLLNLPDNMVSSRRYFYFIPSEGDPRKLVHRIEEKNLDTLPGDKAVYLSWQSLSEGLKSLLDGFQKIAMEFSPDNSIPYVAKVDAGTVDAVRKLGKEVHSSANIIQQFDAVLSDDQIESHLKAAKLVRQCMYMAFDEVRTRLNKVGEMSEFKIQKFLRKRLREHNLTADHGPLVAVNENAGNPHYHPNEADCSIVREGDLLLIDMIGKLDMPGSIYADITWMGYAGDELPVEFSDAFKVASYARDTAVTFLRDRFVKNKPVRGYEVDDVARKVLWDADYGEKFIHRTGHSIGEDVHWNGANIDNLETHDDRLIIPRTCFSIEPGIYTETFGIRTELNIMIMPDSEVRITGGDPQKEIIRF